MTLRDDTVEVMKSSNEELKPTLSIPRPPYRYSINELERLRESLPLVKCNISNLNKKPDIASIFRLPEEVFRNPLQYVCKSKILAEFAAQYRKRHSEREIISDVSEDSEAQITNVMENDIQLSQKTHWNLKRRASTDRSDEPYSAPSGIIAQKTENFQKFYRAVVSPTHVRVTAGGRIVPNTRPTELYGSNLGNDKGHFEIRSSEQIPVNLQAIPWPQLQPVQLRYPTFIPGSVSPPYNVVQSNHSATFSPLAPQQHSGPSVDSNPSERSQIQNSSISSNIKSQEAPFSQGIKISHPSQFDHTKPFVLNGQLIYPLNTVPQLPIHTFPMPINNMFGSANSLHQSHPPVFQQTPVPAALGNMTNSVALPHPSQALNDHQSRLSTEAGLIPPYIPATGIAIPSANILASQLSALSNILNAVEYQIASGNSHGNTDFLEAQRHSLKSQINSIKSALELHQSQDDITEKNDNRDCRLQASTSSRTAQDTETASMDHRNCNFSSTPKMEMEQQESMVANNTNSKIQAKPSTKSRLSISSAKAPPFQPRCQTVISISNKGEVNKKKSDTESTETLSRDSINQSTRTSDDSQKLKDENSNLGETNTFFLPQSQTCSFKPVPLSLNHDYSLNTSSFYNGHNLKNLGAPYLVGALPNGCQYNPHRPFDFVYSRPLNDEERHARYLYFGKASRSPQSGLPKFDGKDFYPASPSKKLPHLKPSYSELNTQAGYNSTVGAPISSNTSPIRRFKSLQNLYTSNEPLSGPADSNCDTVSSQTINSTPNEAILRSNSVRNEKQNDGAGVDHYSKLFMGHSTSQFKSQSPYESVSRLTSLDGQIKISASGPTQNEGNYERNCQQNSNRQLISDENVISGSRSSSPGLGKIENYATNSTIESHLSPKTNALTPRIPQKSFVERVENFRSADQQNLFLQKMLKKNNPILPLVGSALSGAITSENVCGYLPQYRGSAIASLFPTRLTSNISEIDLNCSIDNNSGIRCANDLSSLSISGIDGKSSALNTDEHLKSLAFLTGQVSTKCSHHLTQRGFGGQRNSPK